MTFFLIYLTISILCGTRVAYLMHWPHPDDDIKANVVVVALLLLFGPFIWIAWPTQERP